ncbi:MAG: hypothetical protein ABUT39_06645 [Acidobacteriota bacterium]
MRRRFWTAFLFLALPLAAAESDRAIEVLRYGCANELGHREVTLFQNGTVRLIDGPPGQEWMGLSELSPEELDGAMNRLAAEDLSETKRHMPSSVSGPYIERCELHLLLPGRTEQVFHFTHYDALPLSLSRVLQVAKDMEGKVEDLRGKEELPVDYEARRFDVLKRRDGQRFRIVRFTPDNKAVELQGLDEPLYIFVLREEMHKEFVALLARRK